ncbi:hypothetical protein C7C46_21535 [Streptomyces tateyamensis]|uniref:DUF4034 domain-containing protein n=1 Tax=Streptomyces tateyamensis TaxID=565073 RepID=A0A2V4NM93_9ACTN|nr:hypothetical protein [Streptomyces tateyamensis]PYC76768.1 hypothetical protein C7C46_21535 [Streptomyces tateyamensis]
MTHFLPILGVILVILIRNTRSGGTGIYRPKRAPRAFKPAPASFDAAAYGLAPREALDPTRSGPPATDRACRQSQAVADAAWAGDWRAAAAHLEAAHGDWDEHWSRFELLRSIARRDDGWLTAWREAVPSSCDAAALAADLMVHQAWAIRGSGYAHEVPAANMAKFRALLPAAIEAAQRAAHLDPRNPAPWVVMVTAARGAQYRPDRFQPLWDGLVARAPHHYEGHWQGMQYWCAKWFGSDAKMLGFAERAMDGAPAGSPLAGIYLHALTELEKRRTALPSGGAAKKRLLAVADALALVPAEEENLPTLRHLLARYLLQAGLYEAALQQFRLIGPWCGTPVWSEQGDPVEVFHAARAVAVAKSKAKPLPPELREKHKDVALHL